MTIQRANQLSHVTFLPSGTPCTNTTFPKASRALEDHFQPLLTRAVAPSTSSTYKVGIQRYPSFCQAFGHTPLAGSKCLFVTHLSRTLLANTIQLYVTAVSHVHLTQRLSRPTSSNLMLSLVILDTHQQTHLQQSHAESSHPGHTPADPPPAIPC